MACVSTVSANNSTLYLTNVTYSDVHYPPLFPVTVVISGEEYHSSHNEGNNGVGQPSDVLVSETAVDHIEQPLI